jgi:SAM-dependent methyltransferase
MQWRHRVLLQELKRAGGPLRNALEIGCGHGVAREMVEHDLGIPIDGCDLNLAALRMAKPGKGRVFVYNIFDQEPSMLDRYDAIFLLDVIEHIDDDAAFLTAALRHLRSGGLAVVNVPANTKLFSNYDKAVGHLRRYTAARLSHLLKNCGVAVEVVRPWGLLMLPLLLARKAVLRSVKRAATVRTGLVPPNSAAQLRCPSSCLLAPRCWHGDESITVAVIRPSKIVERVERVGWKTMLPRFVEPHLVGWL